MNNDTPFKSEKAGPLKGTVRIPGDKSISHRALMLGGLAIGETIISGLLEGEDVLCTAEAMKAMGAKINKSSDGLWHVYGTGIGGLMEPSEILDMGNSGTSTRLLMGLVSGNSITAFFTGDKSLIKRPMKRVITPLEMLGAAFFTREGGRLPLGVRGTAKPLPIAYKLPVASAQVKSAVLLAGLNAPGQTVVIEERSTRDHTENMLRHFGVPVETEKMDDGSVSIRITGQTELQPCAIDVPADISSAAFPIVACLIAEGSEIKLPGIGINKLRTGLLDVLLEMGADIKIGNERIQAGEPVADITVRYSGPLKGIDVSPEIVPSMIDEFPVLAMAAACAEGTTKMTGLAELRVKESDRLLLVAKGLEACGASVEMGEDSLTIHGNGKPPKGGCMIETHLDHRIGMSFLVMGLASEEPITIDSIAPIATSFPNFVSLMNDLGANMEDTILPFVED